jgi:hypothetical protein
MTIMRLLIPCEEPGGDWPEVRAEATILARERIQRYELERGKRLAEYSRKWPWSKPEELASNVYRFSREFKV